MPPQDSSTDDPQVPTEARPTDRAASESASSGRRFGARGTVIMSILVVLLVVLALLFAWPESPDDSRNSQVDDVATGSSTPEAGVEDSGQPDENTGEDAVVLSEQTIADLDGALRAAQAPVSGAVVVDPGTGETLYEREPERAMVPASNQKLFTELSVFHHLEPDQRLNTTVVRGGSRDTVVLVAGGDTLLAAGESDADAVEGRAGVATLARRTAQHMLEESTKEKIPARITVETDTSLFQGPALNEAWLPGDIGSGEVGPIFPMAFGGSGSHTRVDAQGVPTGTHDPDAVTSVSQVFTQALSSELSQRTGRSITVAVGGSTDTGADPMKAPDQQEGVDELARVESATITQQARLMMEDSDNRLAETLCRVAAVRVGEQGSVEGSRAAMTEALVAAVGQDVIDQEDVVLTDCAGVAPTNRTSPKVLADLLVISAQDPEGRYGPMLSTLPVAGESGTLTDRFDEPAEAPGRGKVRAKTGTLREVTALAGEVTTHDGDPLIAVVLLNGTSSPEISRNGADRFFAVLAQSGRPGTRP